MIIPLLVLKVCECSYISQCEIVRIDFSIVLSLIILATRGRNNCGIALSLLYLRCSLMELTTYLRILIWRELTL